MTSPFGGRGGVSQKRPKVIGGGGQAKRPNLMGWRRADQNWTQNLQILSQNDFMWGKEGWVGQKIIKNDLGEGRFVKKGPKVANGGNQLKSHQNVGLFSKPNVT